jgi:hypothetical protein
VKRVLAALAAAAALTLAATVFVATPAQAAGGGCNSGDGLITAAVCIGDNGVSVKGDTYVYSGYGGCWRTILTIQESGDGGNTWRTVTDELNFPCRLGYTGSVEATMRSGYYYRTYVIWRFSQGWSHQQWSPLSWK